MPKKRITLSVDSRIYNKYRDYCQEKGIILSKKVEFFLKKELEKIKDEEE
ncbi:MAG: type II toxin-antitoxin system CcdA family antitoxin [Nanoarchaeota archaeon]|nr:type II toxin-antitoxin system CcdA family antitoxin [Nanoarchaeota archaeon]